MKGLGTVIGIAIFLLILLVSLSLILIYLGKFQLVGEEMSQAQLSIYNHNQGGIEIVSAVAYYTVIQYQQCPIQQPPHHPPGFVTKPYEYELQYVKIVLYNPSNVPEGIEYLVFLSPNNNQPIYEYYVGITLSPHSSYTVVIYPNQLYAPYGVQQWQLSEIGQYVPYTFKVDCNGNYISHPTPTEVPVAVFTSYGNVGSSTLSYSTTGG
jgi:hypothetical protein